MKLLTYFFTAWASAAVWLFLLVNWRVTVPVGNGGYLMIKDEANLWQRAILSILVAAIYSASTAALAALVKKLLKAEGEKDLQAPRVSPQSRQ